MRTALAPLNVRNTDVAMLLGWAGVLGRAGRQAGRVCRLGGQGGVEALEGLVVLLTWRGGWPGGVRGRVGGGC